MKKVKIKKLMELDKSLLEIHANPTKKFALPFNDYLTLMQYMKEVGRITDYFFYVQDEFNNQYHDAEKLKEYHERLENDEIEFDVKKVEEFVERIGLK